MNTTIKRTDKNQRISTATKRTEKKTLTNTKKPIKEHVETEKTAAKTTEYFQQPSYPLYKTTTKQSLKQNLKTQKNTQQQKTHKKNKSETPLKNVKTTKELTPQQISTRKPKKPQRTPRNQ